MGNIITNRRSLLCAAVLALLAAMVLPVSGKAYADSPDIAMSQQQMFSQFDYRVCDSWRPGVAGNATRICSKTRMQLQSDGKGWLVYNTRIYAMVYLFGFTGDRTICALSMKPEGVINDGVSIDGVTQTLQYNRKFSAGSPNLTPDGNDCYHNYDMGSVPLHIATPTTLVKFSYHVHFKVGNSRSDTLYLRLSPGHLACSMKAGDVCDAQYP